MIGCLDLDDHSGAKGILALIDLVCLGVESHDDRSVVGAIGVRIPVIVGADAHVVVEGVKAPSCGS